MALEITRYCPSCGSEQPFYMTASTLIQLGKKTKWRCGECDYAIVRVGDEIEADAMAES
jgi:transposase-like protein